MSARTAPAAVVLIRSSAYNSLPSPGNRVGTGDASNMPTIQATTGNNAIKTATGAHHFRIVGCHIRGPSTLLQDAVVKIGGGETQLSQFPTDITIDRCIVRGDATVGLRRGIQLDGIRCAVVDSYVYDCKEAGADTQAIWAYTTPGPLKIVNNYLEASGENLMFGGAALPITGQTPCDIEIRRNYFYKPTAWKSLSWSVKNSFELKTGNRVLIEGNVFENNWLNAQNGFAILFSAKDGDGGASWNSCNDITFRHNKVLNVDQGMNIDNGDVGAEGMARVSVENNFLSVVGQETSQGRMFQILQGPTSLFINHNTGFISNADGAVIVAENTPKADLFQFKNNLTSAGLYGVAGTGTGIGTATLDGHFTNYTFTNNALIAGSGYTYPSNTWFPANTTAVKFTNYAGGDYSLASDSDYKAGAANDATDNTDLGADWTALNEAVLHTVDGQWGSEPATYTDHTYTNAELPRTYVDSSYANQTGTEWICTTAAEFTTALAGCAIGDIITLTAGNTFTGSFTLRNI